MGVLAGRVAVRLQQGQQLVPPLAAWLPVELREKPGRAERDEEAHDLAQRGAEVGALGVLREALAVEVLVPVLAQDVHEGALHLAVGRELLRQLEHRDGAAQMAGVELLDGHVHQLAESLARLRRVLGQRHDLSHRLDLEAGGRRRRSGRGGQGAPAGQALGERPDHLVHRGVDPELPQGRQVRIQLLLVLRLHGRGGHELRGDFRALLGRRGRGAALRLQPVEEESELPEAGGDLSGESSRLSRLGGRGSARFAPQRLHPAQAGRAGRGRGELLEVLAQHLAVLRGTERKHGLAHFLDARAEALVRDELELTHPRHLAHGVEEQVGHGNVGHGRGLLVGPGPDLGRDERGGLLQEQLHRIREHQGRDH